MVGYMIAVGEQSGELESVLDRISQNYEEEIDLAIQRLTAMVEPVIIILLDTKLQATRTIDLQIESLVFQSLPGSQSLGA